LTTLFILAQQTITFMLYLPKKELPLADFFQKLFGTKTKAKGKRSTCAAEDG